MVKMKNLLIYLCRTQLATKDHNQFLMFLGIDIIFAWHVINYWMYELSVNSFIFEIYASYTTDSTNKSSLKIFAIEFFYYISSDLETWIYICLVIFSLYLK